MILALNVACNPTVFYWQNNYSYFFFFFVFIAAPFSYSIFLVNSLNSKT